MNSPFIITPVPRMDLPRSKALVEKLGESLEHNIEDNSLARGSRWEKNFFYDLKNNTDHRQKLTVKQVRKCRELIRRYGRKR